MLRKFRGMEGGTNRNKLARIGTIIQALREAYGWRSVNLARELAISHAYLSNIEAGRRRCTAELARKIAAILGVPLAAITTAYSVSEIGA